MATSDSPYFMQQVSLLTAKQHIEKALESLELDLAASAISFVRCAMEDLTETWEGLAKKRAYGG